MRDQFFRFLLTHGDRITMRCVKVLKIETSLAVAAFILLYLQLGSSTVFSSSNKFKKCINKVPCTPCVEPECDYDINPQSPTWRICVVKASQPGSPGYENKETAIGKCEGIVTLSCREQTSCGDVMVPACAGSLWTLPPTTCRPYCTLAEGPSNAPGCE